MCLLVWLCASCLATGSIVSFRRAGLRTYMHMDKYINNCIISLGLESIKVSRIHKRPITHSITTEQEKLTPGDHYYFQRALGMLGWLANTARPDVAYSHSRIGQHAASPTQEAKEAVMDAFIYLRSTSKLAISIQLYDELTIRQIYANKPDCTERWKFYCDSDYAGNDESQNKRRSQNANVFMVDGAPVHWTSKVSSVAFAHDILTLEKHMLTCLPVHVKCMQQGMLLKTCSISHTALMRWESQRAQVSQSP